MEDLLAIDEHGAVAQVVTARGQEGAQAAVTAAIADLQPGDATAQLAQHGEVAAERAAAVEHQHRMGCRGWLGCRVRHWGLGGCAHDLTVAEGPRH